MSADAILEMIAFWSSVIAAAYFFNKGRKIAGWISVACAVILPILVGLVFVLTGSNTKANPTPLSPVPALRPMQDAQRPTFTEPVTLFGESQDLTGAANPAKGTGGIKESGDEWCKKNKPWSTFVRMDSTDKPVCMCEDSGLISYCEFKRQCAIKALTKNSHCVQREDRAWMCDIGFFEFRHGCYSRGKMTEICQEQFGYGYIFGLVKNGMSECMDLSNGRRQYLPI
jgi:hypothetical protein